MRVEGYIDWQTDLANPDFVKLAEFMNIAAWEVKESKDVELAFSNGFKHKGPALINIFTESTHLYDVMKKAGFEIVIASPKGRNTPLEERSLMPNFTMIFLNQWISYFL